MRILPFGDDALLIEVADTSAVIALAASLPDRPAGIADVVPAARTILVTFDPAVIGRAGVEAWVAATPPERSVTTHSPEVILDVTYDGADLGATAAALGVSVARLVDDHLGASWTVAFTGFAPGFGYLTSPDWQHRVPRLAAPRTVVPAGSVALADGFCGAYPRSTPGGWRLIGRTDAALFDAASPQPALLTPGTRVRFREAS